MAVPQGEGDPSGAELKAFQGSAAALVPLTSWKGPSSLIWSVKWTVNGLMPLRPQVLLLDDLSLDQNQSYLAS